MRNGQLQYCRQSTISAVHGANYDQIRRRTQSSNYDVDHTLTEFSLSNGQSRRKFAKIN
jgi:hypothetical protein